MPHFEHNALTLLLTQLAAVLALSRALGWGLRRIGQPLVIAEVLAGIVLGPSLLGWLWPEAMGALFPESSLPDLRMLSQLGLVLFMFLVGLEIDLELMRGRAHASIAISHTGIAVPFVLGAAASFWIQDHYAQPGAPFLSLLLFMGVAMSITAFPVLARILSERQLLNTRLGTITIACAAVDDVTAWCLLAFVVAVARSQDLTQAAWTTALAVIYVVVMLAVIRPFLARLGERVANQRGLTQAMVVGALLLLLASSWITETIGIHALFGAFVAGSCLPKKGGFASALSERIETVAVALLLPLFFAYSGLRTEIGLLSTATDWFATLAIIGVATLGKFGGGIAAARLTGSSWREASAIGILMNTRGLMQLIVLNIGLDLGVISPTLFTILVVMALMTTVATAPVLSWIYPLDELMRERARRPEPAEGRPAAPYRLLLCVSDARTGPALASLAAALAQTGGAGREVTALHLAPPSDRPSAELRPGAAAHDPLVPLMDNAARLGLPIRPLTFVSADPGGDILRTADALRADLVMLGAHRPLLAEGRLGGVVRDVMTRSASPVAVLIDQGFVAPRRVLVPYAGAPQDRFALALAQRLAADPATQVTLLHAVAPGPADTDGEGRRRIASAMESGRADALSPLGNVTLKLMENDVPETAAVEESARGYDLVIAAIAPDLEPIWRGLAFRRRRLLTDCPVSLLLVRPSAAAEG